MAKNGKMRGGRKKPGRPCRGSCCSAPLGTEAGPLRAPEDRGTDPAGPGEGAARGQGGLSHRGERNARGKWPRPVPAPGPPPGRAGGPGARKPRGLRLFARRPVPGGFAAPGGPWTARALETCGNTACSFAAEKKSGKINGPPPRGPRPARAAFAGRPCAGGGRETGAAGRVADWPSRVLPPPGGPEGAAVGLAEKHGKGRKNC